MKVKVDEDVCIGSMSCENSCPEVFKVVGGISRVQVDVVPADAEDELPRGGGELPGRRHHHRGRVGAQLLSGLRT